MIGKYALSVKTKQVSFDLVIERQVTVVLGETATGKSYFADAVAQYVREGELGHNHTIRVDSEFDFVAVVSSPDQWDTKYKDNTGGLFIMDEEVVSALKGRLSDIVLHSDNYFLFITRLTLDMIPYSMWEIYEFNSVTAVESGRSYTKTIAIKEYAEDSDWVHLDRVLVEDGKSGCAFFQAALPNTVIESAKGNSNIHIKLRELLFVHKGEHIGVILDSAAYGAFIDRLSDVIHESPKRNQITIFTPESFEWLVLNTRMFSRHCTVLSKPYDYCETTEYCSWEDFFTEELRSLTKSIFGINYSKKIDNPKHWCIQLFLRGRRDILNLLRIR